MQRSAPPEFRLSDAWLLAAVDNAQQTKCSPAPVLDVLESADGMNKTPMFLQELNGGVTRLDRAGYLVLHEDLSLALTQAGRDLVERARGERRSGELWWWDGIGRLLGVSPASRDDDPRAAGDGHAPISAEALRAAEKVRRKQRRKARRAERRRSQPDGDAGAG